MQNLMIKALFDAAASPVGLVLVLGLGLVIGHSIGRSLEAKRWASVARSFRFPMPAHKQSIWYRGVEFVVMSMRRYQDFLQETRDG